MSILAANATQQMVLYGQMLISYTDVRRAHHNNLFRFFGRDSQNKMDFLSGLFGALS
ncbi:MAG: hypothetical protein PWQ17_1798 [Anaerophaga sp.]|nr:hypothetical protein [Anaerophaga sp.]